MFPCYLSICIRILLLFLKACEACDLWPGRFWVLFSQAREKRYKPFIPKCPWLGEIRSFDSPAGYKLLELFGLVYFPVSASSSHLPRHFPSFLLLLPCLIPPTQRLPFLKSFRSYEGVDFLTNNYFLLTRDIVPVSIGYGSLSLPGLRETRGWDLRLEWRGCELILSKHG